MLPLIGLILTVIDLYKWVLIVAAVLSWLLMFGVVNAYSPAIRVINDFCYRLTEPALRPLRRIIPSVGGIDISFIVLFLLLQLLAAEIQHYAFRYLG